MSRLLGSPGAFQLGQSMRACTCGIWMATTILECEQFATIVLDTEGIDAIGASETNSAIDGVSSVNGSMLAALACGYVMPSTHQELSIRPGAKLAGCH